MLGMTLVAIEREGVLGACPFEVLHQFQLGLLKYILTSLFHYRSVPCHFQGWLDKRSSPSLSIATKVMIKQSWHYMILGYKTAPIIRQG